MSPGIVEHSVLTRGKKSAVPTGTVHARVACARKVPGEISVAIAVPPRNQTFPVCPALQSAVSNSGWPSTGSEKAQRHHSSLHPSYDLPRKFEFTGATAAFAAGLEILAPAAIA